MFFNKILLKVFYFVLKDVSNSLYQCYIFIKQYLEIICSRYFGYRMDNRLRRFNVLLREFLFNNLWVIDVFYDFRCDIKIVIIFIDVFLSIEMI